MIIKIVVGFASAVIPWVILLLINLGVETRAVKVTIPRLILQKIKRGLSVRLSKRRVRLQMLWQGVPIKEAGFYGISLLNIVIVIGSAVLFLKYGWVFYWPAFLIGYMFFAVPMFLLAMIGSLVESDNERRQELEDSIRLNTIINNGIKKRD